MEKIKVVWICHFSNQQTRSNLKLSSTRFFYRLIAKIIGKEPKNRDYKDFAPWISILIEEFEKFEDVELHVISPQVGLKGISSQFNLNGVHYYFYNPDFTLFLSYLIKNVALWLKIQPSSFIVKRFLKKIKPDIINLIGAENYYHSCVVLDIEKIPILVTCQTIFTNPQRLQFQPHADKSKNWAIELLIQQKEKYFACGGRMHRDLLIENNREAIVLKGYLPAKTPGKIEEQVHEYDFVCFAAGHDDKKGTKDAIEAISLVKVRKPDVRLNIVGKCSPDYREILDKIIIKLGLIDNIVFHSYFAEHADLFRQVKKSKFALLPVKMDVISSTTREAMHLGIPVITYRTSGTPLLNKEKECVLLADIGDINKLVENMILLLESDTLANKLRLNAQEYVDINFNNAVEAIRLKKIYRAVILHNTNGSEIPKELLFDIDNYPIYS
jgi:glycosyltransferase involved in cell wall biosynthesis